MDGEDATPLGSANNDDRTFFNAYFMQTTLQHQYTSCPEIHSLDSEQIEISIIRQLHLMIIMIVTATMLRYY